MAQTTATPSENKPKLRDLLVVVFFTTMVMTLASMSVLWIPAIAPAVAADLGISPSLVGYQFTLAYIGAMTSSLLVGGFVQRFGAWRTSQCSLGMLAIGHLILMSGHLELMVVGSIATGFGYGMMNPPAMDLLNRVVTPSNRNLVFSVRFTGVPLGGVLASLVAPSLTLAVGWQPTMMVVGALGLVLFAAMQPLRARFDANRQREASVIRDPFSGLKLILRSRALRFFAFTGLCFAAVQLSLMSFAVTLLVDEVGWTLVSAGVALSCVQVAGVIGRVSWGVIADRLRSSTAVLIIIGSAMAVASLTASQIEAAWPQIAVFAFFFVFGLVAVGWNGVFASEAARLSPPGSIGHATGGVLFITFSGVLFGPVVFSMLFQVTGSYSATFLASAALAALGVAFLGVSRRAARSDAAQ
ncbi:MFS transporter [Thalassobaculum sp. OXR-137]|uniref:MFS transporter n=1 Tax=Thalassobaculum sp. OXR-137 TaxID=3100173 RepID=UPI002AC8E1CE|nr:MFS transporter [Thalassobaculum sp. OXR-137]WPZ34368.1 MFS transporter [Thalassobaculum sp. OXR-137]